MESKQVRRKALEPIKHTLKGFEGLSLLFFFRAYKRAAERNGLWRSELEGLTAIDSMCRLNVKRLGFARTAASELRLVLGMDRRQAEKLLWLLKNKGMINIEKHCACLPRQANGYYLSRAGVEALKSIDREIHEEQIRINNYHKYSDKR